MTELQTFILQSSARINSYSALLTNRSANLSIALTLSGPEAQYFGRDLEFRLADWQINSPEELHLQLLDLNKECRLKKISLNFGLSLKIESQLILACQGGQILLQRQGQIKELLACQNELGMLVGQYQDQDQLLILVGDQAFADANILKKADQWTKTAFEAALSTDWLKNQLGILAWLSYVKQKKVPITEKVKKKKQHLINKIKQILKLIQNILKKIKNLSSSSKKRYLKLSLIFLSIIVLSGLTFYFWQNNQQKQLAILSSELETLMLSEADLSQLSAQQPVLAREKLAESENNLQSLLIKNSQPASKKLIQAALDRVRIQLNDLESENNLDRLTVYANWRELYPDFLGKKILSSPQGLLIGDMNRQALLLVNNDQTMEYLALKWQDFTLDRSQSNNLTILIKDNGLKELTWGNQSSKELKSEGDSDRAASLIASYQNYLYLFNPEKRNIYRYTQNKDGLSEAIGWLIEKQGINFSEVSDISVDGDLWLSFKNGEVRKFSRGYQSEFNWQGLATLPNNNLLISTKENIDLIVFLDKNAKRLLVTTKEGQLISEIKSNELAGVSDIDLASDGQSCFALSGSVIYQIQL